MKGIPEHDICLSAIRRFPKSSYSNENTTKFQPQSTLRAQSCSWNRKEPTDYKIVTIDMNDLEVNDFATGWLKEGNVLGRPVDIITNDDGSLFVSDDDAGKIYRVYYEK